MRTHYCGSLTEELIGQTVTVVGWVHRRRDHSHVIFFDLRDREGLLQVIVEKEDDVALYDASGKMRNEYIIQVTGKVRARDEAAYNLEHKSGKIELVAQKIDVVATSDTPPFPLNDDFTTVSEELRLKYRFLDIRRPWNARAFAFSLKSNQLNP